MAQIRRIVPNINTIMLEIMDSYGKIVYFRVIPGGTSTYKLDLSGFETGSYIVHISSHEINQREKLIITK